MNGDDEEISHDMADENNRKRRNIFKEVQNLIKVQSEYVVRVFGAWKESDYLYIQMELCSDSLYNILQIKRQLFARKYDKPMNRFEYIISCKIFRQILECVQYLHELSPQIIHRDLKPENILIAVNAKNGRFIKLGDFGLATVHDKLVNYVSQNRHSSRVGDIRYMAPEVSRKDYYGHKADI
ncbi:unnamed protein product [Oppiella nova]|uniref:Protein kinase domain-containing protein n=1 Tax=Oppiella nova TaxID=334625 RepID=A0A7R9M5V1_9ACAR|nr:unnamed protein product [Oppiella nova]CAG2170793.1 unnamed protein product [Oppiella nova]